jgi:hypothetical protein
MEQIATVPYYNYIDVKNESNPVAFQNSVRHFNRLASVCKLVVISIENDQFVDAEQYLRRLER